LKFAVVKTQVADDDFRICHKYLFILNILINVFACL
jgi:hypothetical protein